MKVSCLLSAGLQMGFSALPPFLGRGSYNIFLSEEIHQHFLHPLGLIALRPSRDLATPRLYRFVNLIISSTFVEKVWMRHWGGRWKEADVDVGNQSKILFRKHDHLVLKKFQSIIKNLPISHEKSANLALCRSCDGKMGLSVFHFWEKSW